MDPIRKCLYGYHNIDVTAKHISLATMQFRGLRCRSSPFVFENGRKADLALLEGTIPVLFKGVSYNIPICIWIMQSHPTHPPICYVKPTSDMHIKMSQYVDHNGKIYLPYLNAWTVSQSDLLGLIQVMIVTFGEQPPVFSKPKTADCMPNTPYLPQVSGYMPMPMPVNMQQGGGHSSVSSSPYPQYPSGMPVPPCVRGTHSDMPSMPPVMMPHQPVNTPFINSPNDNRGNSGTITEQHIKVSLLSAIEHKVKRRLEELACQHSAELEILNHTAKELQQGSDKLKSIIDKLNHENVELERNIKILQEKDEELGKAIEELSEENEVDVDEAVTTTAPLYKQILNAYAEEAATEDAIYYMGEALRRGVIDLEVFLKQVRQLSRKQFILRAIMQKCRLKAGLSG